MDKEKLLYILAIVAIVAIVALTFQATNNQCVFSQEKSIEQTLTEQSPVEESQVGSAKSIGAGTVTDIIE